MILSPKLFVMVDDSLDELAISKALFKRHYPTIEVLCEHKPERLAPLLQRRVTDGLDASSIVVLIDIRMPGLNGFELIYTLRNTVELYRSTIMVLSASRAPSDFDDALGIGADGFIRKPFNMAKLEEALGQIAERRPQQAIPATDD